MICAELTPSDVTFSVALRPFTLTLIEEKK